MGCDAPGEVTCCANGRAAHASDAMMVGVAEQVPQRLQNLTETLSCKKVAPQYAWVLRLVEHEGPGILRLLWRVLGREQDVMDAYQDCFCKLAARGRRGGLTNAKAYAYRTAMNIAVEMIRVRNRRATHWPAVVADRVRMDAAGGEEGAGSDRLSALRDAVAALPDHLRNVIVLRDLSRLPYERIGRILGIEPTTARVYRRHAVIMLAEVLRQGVSE